MKSYMHTALNSSLWVYIFHCFFVSIWIYFFNYCVFLSYKCEMQIISFYSLLTFVCLKALHNNVNDIIFTYITYISIKLQYSSHFNTINELEIIYCIDFYLLLFRMQISAQPPKFVSFSHYKTSKYVSMQILVLFDIRLSQYGI